jgi:Tfp pilus assembly protein PilV
MKAEKKSGARRKAFSLMEVMIASALFFMAVFAILGLVSSSLNNLRRLQRPLVDASALASELSLTNKLTEGTDSGNLGDLLGKDYNAYTWTSKIQEVQTNKLFQVDFVVQNIGGDRSVVSQISVLLFRPQSDAGILDGGMGHK